MLFGGGHDLFLRYPRDLAQEKQLVYISDINMKGHNPNRETGLPVTGSFL